MFLIHHWLSSPSHSIDVIWYYLPWSGGAALDLNSVDPKPKKWIQDMTWLNLVELSNKLPMFRDLPKQVAGNDKVIKHSPISSLLLLAYCQSLHNRWLTQGWKTWFDTDAPEEETIPDGYNNISLFHKLLLIRSWCPDRVIPMAKKYIADCMGQRVSQTILAEWLPTVCCVIRIIFCNRRRFWLHKSAIDFFYNS